MIARLFAAALAGLLVPPLALADTLSGVRLGPLVTEEDFVTLDESSLFGPGGTLVDVGSRIGFQTPLDETLPLPDSEYTTTNTALGATCSTDNSDAATLAGLLSGGSPVADRTIITIPPCTVRAFHNPDAGTIMTIAKERDYVVLRGTPGLSEIEIIPNTGSGAANWEPALGDVNRDPFDGNLFVIGTENVVLNPIDEPCNVVQTTTAPGAGEFVLTIDSADCQIQLSGTPANGDNVVHWGANDAMRIQHNVFENAGSARLVDGKLHFPFRNVCVRDFDGDESGNCAGVPAGNNKIKMSDPLLVSFATAAGTHYGATPTLEVAQVENVGAARGGVGTETQNVAEYIGFEGITFKRRYPGLYEREAYIRGLQYYDLWISDGKIAPGSGSPISLKFDADRTLIFRTEIEGPFYANSCMGKIVSLQRTNPVRLTVQSGNCCGLRSEYQAVGATSGEACPDQRLWVSQDANIPGIAGKYFKRTIITPNLTGSTGNTVLELDGIDGTGLPVEAENPGGLVGAIDDFGMGFSYVSTGAANFQIVNSWVSDRRAPYITESGGYGHLMYGVYERHSDQVVHSRGRFPHGNSGAPGDVFEMNDTDSGPTLYATSNGYSSSGGGTREYNGEGNGRFIASSRIVQTPASALPSYGDTKTKGQIDNSEDAHQGGFANDKWHLIGLLFHNFMTNSGTAQAYIDNADGTGTGSGVNVPYMAYRMASFLNRCYASGCSIDDNFEPSENPTTIRDAGYTGTTVPSGLQSLRSEYPASFSRSTKPWWWCNEAVQWGHVGALWDDITAGYDSLAPIPADILANGGICTHQPRADGVQ